MDFAFDPVHLELANILRRRLTGEYDLAHRRASMDNDSDPVGVILSELGVNALLVDEADGGLGQGSAALMLTMQELGRALAVTSFWGTAVAARALQWSNALMLRSALLPRVIDGSLRMALALTERHARHDLESVRTVSRRNPQGFTLTGEKTGILFGAHADYWLVTARCESTLQLFLVPANSANVRVQAYRCVDGFPAADIVLDDTPVTGESWLNESADGIELLLRVADFGASLLCAEAIGLMERAKEDTIAHLQSRKQFGSPLSSFQVLQHRMVDVAMQVEQARSLTFLAVATACDADSNQRVRAVSAAKALVGTASLFAARQCVQLHGASGLTDAMAVSHILKRLTMMNQTFGDSDHHFMRFAAKRAAVGT